MQEPIWLVRLVSSTATPCGIKKHPVQSSSYSSRNEPNSTHLPKLLGKQIFEQNASPAGEIIHISSKCAMLIHLLRSISVASVARRPRYMLIFGFSITHAKGPERQTPASLTCSSCTKPCYLSRAICRWLFIGWSGPDQISREQGSQRVQRLACNFGKTSIACFFSFDTIYLFVLSFDAPCSC